MIRLGSRFRDQSRFLSAAVTRAFSSATRASSRGAQSELSAPDEVTLHDPDDDAPDTAVVRGLD